MTAALPVHPAADLFPMLPASELQALADDIKANGQREPVVIWEGSVLDGRNRLAACRLAGVEPLTRTLDACPDPLAFVLSLNLTRRHLDESQRAMVAAKVRPMLAEQARARQVASQAKPGEKVGERTVDKVSPNLGPPEGKSADQAAEMLNVGRGTVEAAAKVLKRGVPELVTAVETKSVAVSAAAVLVSLPEDEQREVVAAGPDAIKAKVKAIRESKPKREPKGNGAPAPTKTPGQVAEEKIRAATTFTELDAAYQEVSKAGLTDRECEAVADARQDRGAELRAQTQTTAPAPAPAASQPALPALASTVPTQHRLFDEPHASLASMEPWLDGRAKRVMRSGTPEMVAAVWAGEVTVRTAADLVSLPAERQKAILAGGPGAIRSAAKEIRERQRKRKAKPPEAAPVQLVIVEMSEVGALWAEIGRLRVENEALRSAAQGADASHTRRPALKVIQGFKP